MTAPFRANTYANANAVRVTIPLYPLSEYLYASNIKSIFQTLQECG